MPFEKDAPIKIPTEAKANNHLKLKALEPTAEFRKFTASLLTPTIKSKMARMKSIAIKMMYKVSI